MPPAGLLNFRPTANTVRIVPARGKVTNGTDIKAFRDMIVTVRDHVQHMIDTGQTEDQVLAEHPTAQFDARWAHGRVRPEAFAHAIYAALKAPQGKG